MGGAVVLLQSKRSNESSVHLGTAFFVGPKQLLTTKHQLRATKKVHLRLSDGSYFGSADVTRVGDTDSDDYQDWAWLTSDRQSSAWLTLGACRRGDEFYLRGFPSDLGNRPRTIAGAILAKGQALELVCQVPGVNLQGLSGAPVVLRRNDRVVGLLSGAPTTPMSMSRIPGVLSALALTEVPLPPGVDESHIGSPCKYLEDVASERLARFEASAEDACFRLCDRVRDKFDQFLSSRQPSLFIVGERGIGRTATIRRLCAEFRTAAYMIPMTFPTDRSVAEFMQDLASDGVGLREGERILDRISAVAHRAGRPVIFLLDDVGEVDVIRARGQLDYLAETLGGPATSHIKIAAFVETYVWHELRDERGQPATFLGGVADKDWVWNLTGLDSTQLRLARYHLFSKYQIDGVVPQHLEATLRNPSMLVAFAQIHRSSSVPRFLASKKFSQQLLNRLCSRAASKKEARRALIAVAEEIWQQSDEDWPSFKPIEVRDSDQVDLLLKLGFLKQRIDEHGRREVGFRNHWILVYVVAYLVLGLDKSIGQGEMPAQQKTLAEYRLTPLKQTILGWYAASLPPERLLTLFAAEVEPANAAAQAWSTLCSQFPAVYDCSYAGALLVSDTDCSRPWLAITCEERADVPTHWLKAPPHLFGRPWAVVQSSGRSVLRGPVSWGRTPSSERVRELAVSEFHTSLTNANWIVNCPEVLTDTLLSELMFGIARKNAESLGLGESKQYSTGELRMGLRYWYEYSVLERAHHREKFWEPQKAKALAEGRVADFYVSHTDAKAAKRLRMEASILAQGPGPAHPNDREARLLARCLDEATRRNRAAHDVVPVELPPARWSKRDVFQETPIAEQLRQYCEAIFGAVIDGVLHLYSTALGPIAAELKKVATSVTLTGDIYRDGGTREYCHSILCVEADRTTVDFQFNDGERNRDKRPSYPLFEPRPPIVFSYHGTLRGVERGDGPYVTGLEDWIEELLRRHCPALKHLVNWVNHDLQDRTGEGRVRRHLEQLAAPLGAP